MSDANESHINGRYILQEKLGEGGMGAVYRAVDRLSQQTVALKRVTVSGEKLQFASQAPLSDSSDFRLALAQEFKTLASLRHPHIISVLDYGFDVERQPFLTMELLKDAPNLIEAGRGLSQPQQIDLLVQLLQALAYLHRRAIIHRDLKPDNVLVIEGQVKVLDFGLAVAARRPDGQGSDIYGTPAYMAPEVFEGQPASKASDLYAVGLMAYELFAGQHPFNTTNLAILMMDILKTVPDTTTLGLDDQLTQILDTLLAKSPQARYSDARDVIDIYAEATNRQDLLVETSAIRESYLQAAEFVGREAEFDQLIKALTMAQSGQGSAWLVGGESGVGKSRLLEEVRTQALVEGALVLQGQAIDEGGAPYHIWREPLRRLCLAMELSELEAAVFKMMVPDIDNLLGREVVDASSLDPEATYNRLLRVIVDVLRRFDQPLIIILEDMQWAGDESVKLLSDLTRSVAEMRLLLLVSYRDDEQPHLPQALPSMKSLILDRLNGEELATLTESMLGSAGREPALLELLQRETEGNTYFVVEVVRSLAEEAGQLGRIGEMSLPQSVSAEGIAMIIERRLERATPPAHSLLPLAALAGRRINVELLRTLGPAIDIEAWLNQAAEARVLEMHEGRWQFAHDKLRETAVSKLSAEEKKSFHREIAEAIELCYAPDLSRHYPLLAYHFGQAIDRDHVDATLVSKTITYLEQSGQQALSSNANREAIRIFGEVVGLDPLLERASPSLRRARWQSALAMAYKGLGQLQDAQLYFENTLDILKKPAPNNNLRLIIKLLGQVGQQILHRLYPEGFIRQLHGDQAQRYQQAAQVNMELTLIYYLAHDNGRFLHSALSSLNLAERIPPVSERAVGYALLCVLMGFVGRFKWAEAYADRAMKMTEELDSPAVLADALTRIAVYRGGAGQWKRGQDEIEQAIAYYHHINDQRNWGDSSNVLIRLLFLHGDYEESLKLASELYAAAQDNGNRQHQGWAREVSGGCLLQLGQLDKARDHLEAALTIYGDDTIATEKWGAEALLALTYFRLGKICQAIKLADKALEIVVGTSPSVFVRLNSHLALADVYFAVWEKSHNSALSAELNPDDLLKSSQSAIKSLRKFAGVFPIGKAASWLSQGIYDWQRGQPGQTRKKWAKALAAADAQELLYEKGRAHYEIGRHLPQADPDRQRHLQLAVDSFRKLGTVYYEELAAAELRIDHLQLDLNRV